MIIHICFFLQLSKLNWFRSAWKLFTLRRDASLGGRASLWRTGIPRRQWNNSNNYKIIKWFTNWHSNNTMSVLIKINFANAVRKKIWSIKMHSVVVNAIRYLYVQLFGGTSAGSTIKLTFAHRKSYNSVFFSSLFFVHTPSARAAAPTVHTLFYWVNKIKPKVLRWNIIIFRIRRQQRFACAASILPIYRSYSTCKHSNGISRRLYTYCVSEMYSERSMHCNVHNFMFVFPTKIFSEFGATISLFAF